MTKSPAAHRPRLTLEDYILFFTTHSGTGLTIDLLNQILFMHGFSKYHRSNKAVIVDALNSLDLLRPRRHTVSLNAGAPSPRAAAAVLCSTEDVRRDIEELGWGACPVGSIHAEASPAPLAAIPMGSATVQRVSPPSILDTSSLLPVPGVAAKRKRCPMGKGKAAVERRERRMADLLTLPSVEDISAEWQADTSTIV